MPVEGVGVDGGGVNHDDGGVLNWEMPQVHDVVVMEVVGNCLLGEVLVAST